MHGIQKGIEEQHVGAKHIKQAVKETAVTIHYSSTNRDVDLQSLGAIEFQTQM